MNNYHLSVVTCCLLRFSIVYSFIFILKLSAAKAMRLLSGHIFFPRNASKFTCIHLYLKNLNGKSPQTSAYKVGIYLEEEKGRGGGRSR